MTSAEKQARVTALITEFENQLDEIKCRYNSKYYLADTHKEILAIQEWHKEKLSELNEWYGRKMYEAINAEVTE